MFVLSHLNYGYLPAVFLGIGAFIYIIAIFRGAKPLVGTWVTYTLLTGLTAHGMYARDAITPLVVVAIIADIIILGLAMGYRGVWQWSTVDRWCFGAAAVGGTISIITSSPELAIATGVLATTAAAIPTALKGFLRPWTESGLAYAIFIISSGFAVMQMPSWAFVHSFQPIMWLINGGVTFVVLMRSRATLRRCISWYRSKVPRKHRRA